MLHACYPKSERLTRDDLIISLLKSEPIPVAQTFSFVHVLTSAQFSYVDTMVTVVDAFNFFKDFGSPETLMDRKLTDIEGDSRTIVNLLTDQIEFANVIGKSCDQDRIGILRAAIHKAQ